MAEEPKTPENTGRQSKIIAREKIKHYIELDKKPKTPSLPKKKFKNVSITSIEQSSEIYESCYQTLKNVCMSAVQFQKHCHRDKLSGSDMNKASEFYMLNNPFGDHDTTDDIIDLEIYIDKTLKYKESEKLFYCGKYLHFPKPMFSEDLLVNQTLKNYFMFTMKGIFGTNTELFAFLISDLKRNAHLLPLLPIFIENLCSNIMLLNYPPLQLKKSLQVMHSLYQNPNLHFQNKYLYQVLNFAISCATSNLHSLSHTPEDSYSLQDTSAELIGEMLSKPLRSKALLNYALKNLELPFKKSELKLRSCYGAIISLISIGLPAIAFVIPNIFLTYLEKLENSLGVQDQFTFVKDTGNLEITRVCSDKKSSVVRGKLMNACELLLKYYLHKALDLTKTSLKYSVKFSERDKAFESTTENLPLTFVSCPIILKFFGEELYERFPMICNESNKEVPLVNFFEQIVNLELNCSEANNQ